SGFRADTVHGKTWGVRGQTPVVERPGQRQSVSAASAVTAQGAFWFSIYEGALNGALFVEFLKQMMYRRRKPVHLILDSLPAHKRAIVSEYVASTQGRLTHCISCRAMRQTLTPTSWCGVMLNVQARRGALCRRVRSCARKSKSSSRASKSCPV